MSIFLNISCGNFEQMIGATFEQLQVFVTLGRQGSLAGAARALGKSPSAVTAIMQVLEGVAGISLCDRTGYRAVLSAQGRDLLPRAELILREMQAWRAQAQSMATGIESELVIAIDALYSIEWIAPVLSTFRDRYPDVTLTLRTEISSRAVAAVITGDAPIGILVDFRPTKDLFRATPLGQVKLVAVCAPSIHWRRLVGHIVVIQSMITCRLF
ncbi:LysR family transcriptional regulator [Komagataeibacter rhaeticus]|nr:LysR family transcriptional regulator [Komagataeibacter rhaeticus]